MHYSERFLLFSLLFFFLFLSNVDMSGSAGTHSALIIIAWLLFPCHESAQIIPVARQDLAAHSG